MLWGSPLRGRVGKGVSLRTLVVEAPRPQGRPPSGGKTLPAERCRLCASGGRFPHPQPRARGVGPGGRGWRRPPAREAGKAPELRDGRWLGVPSSGCAGQASPEPAEPRGPRTPYSPLCEAAPSPAAPLTCT